MTGCRSFIDGGLVTGAGSETGFTESAAVAMLSARTWQPIETVPRGVPILVTDGHYITSVTLEDWEYSACGFNPHSHGFGGYEIDPSFQPEELTYWMALPEMPPMRKPPEYEPPPRREHSEAERSFFGDAGEFIDMLRNRSVAAQLSTRPYTNLKGPVAFPKLEGGSRAHWVPEPGTEDEWEACNRALELTNSIESEHARAWLREQNKSLESGETAQWVDDLDEQIFALAPQTEANRPGIARALFSDDSQVQNGTVVLPLCAKALEESESPTAPRYNYARAVCIALGLPPTDASHEQVKARMRELPDQRHPLEGDE